MTKVIAVRQSNETENGNFIVTIKANGTKNTPLGKVSHLFTYCIAVQEALEEDKLANVPSGDSFNWSDHEALAVEFPLGDFNVVPRISKDLKDSNGEAVIISWLQPRSPNA